MRRGRLLWRLFFFNDPATTETYTLSLHDALPSSEHHLAPEGRLAVITFHSGEDREVRRFLSGRARAGHWALSSGKPTRPQADEVAGNRRARSAVLRWAIRTKGEGKG